jgi:hypothetical protein
MVHNKWNGQYIIFYLLLKEMYNSQMMHNNWNVQYINLYLLLKEIYSK